MYTCSCRDCKKLFQSSIEREYCEECIKKYQDPFDQIVKYLEEFPNSNAMQISEALNIPIHIILGYIDSQMLHMVKGTFDKIP